MDNLFRQWIDAHQDPVWSLARYLLDDRTEAEDVCQEAFIRLWQHRESMTPEKVRPWLLRVARNLSLDRLRQRRPQQPLEAVELAAPEGAADGVEQQRLQRRLAAAVTALAEPYRSLVVLRDIQQHSYEEVAGVLGLSLPQVKTYLHRARKQLRAQLEDMRP